MKNILLFVGAWILGLFCVNKFIFSLMSEFIHKEIAVAIFCVLIIVTYTVTLAVVVHEK